MKTSSKENSSQYIDRISREYGMYVLDSRAIPSFYDGLKTSQRIALYLMRNKSSKIKTIAMAGEMIASNLYVHGDTSAADAVSLMAAPYNNNECLVHGHGAFGTRTDPVSGIAAPRYTYVSKSKVAEKILYKDMDIIPMMDNYDGSAQMPSTFLPLIPLVLLNGVAGIATGWSTNILQHSMNDISNAVHEVLTTGKVQTKIMPSFGTYDVDVVELEPNKYVVVGKLHKKNTSTVVVTELPPNLSSEAFRKHLNDLEEKGKIVGYTDDTTELVNVEIKFTRSELAKYSDAALIELLRIRSIITERFVTLYEDGVHQFDSAEELVEKWVEWRLTWYKDRYEKMLKDEEYQSLFLISFMACFEPIMKKGHPPIYEALLMLKNKDDLRTRIGEHIKAADLPVNDSVVEKIAGLPMYRWILEGYNDAVGQLEQCDKNIIQYEGIISSSTKRKNIFKKEVQALL